MSQSSSKFVPAQLSNMTQNKCSLITTKYFTGHFRQKC